MNAFNCEPALHNVDHIFKSDCVSLSCLVGAALVPSSVISQLVSNATSPVFSVLQSQSRTIFCFPTDRGVQGDLPFSLHHMARLWCAGISCLLPQIPLQGPGVWFAGPRARALCGALQRWDRTLRNLRLGGHLPDPGRCGGGGVASR